MNRDREASRVRIERDAETGLVVTEVLPLPAPVDRRVKFDADAKFRYLAAIRAGSGRYEAARFAGVHSETVRRHAAGSEEWRGEVRAAELESLEVFEDVLKAQALSGEAWALKFVLGKLGRKVWAEKDRGVAVTVSGEIGVTGVAGGAGVDLALAELIAELAGRAGGGVIDAEAWEAGDEPQIGSGEPVEVVGGGTVSPVPLPAVVNRLALPAQRFTPAD